MPRGEFLHPRIILRHEGGKFPYFIPVALVFLPLVDRFLPKVVRLVSPALRKCEVPVRIEELLFEPVDFLLAVLNFVGAELLLGLRQFGTCLDIRCRIERSFRLLDALLPLLNVERQVLILRHLPWTARRYLIEDRPHGPDEEERRKDKEALTVITRLDRRFRPRGKVA